MEILGVDIGGSGIKGAIVDTTTGKLVSDRVRIQTPSPASPEAIANTLLKLVLDIGYKGPVGCGFPARVIDGKVKTASNIDKSWIDVDARDLFSKTLNTDVFIANDADVAGLAEMHFGYGAQFLNDDIIFLTVGTGIGSALFVKGQLFANTELGHIKMHGDSAEKYCSDKARKRDDLSWIEFALRLNEYLLYLDFILNPKAFILGGGLSKKFDKVKDKLDLKDKIFPAKTLNYAGIIGSALLCTNK